MTLHGAGGGPGASWGTGPAPVPRIVVVGGGISGLAAAHRVLEVSAGRRQVDLILVEARDRLGGVISTERAGGFLIEGGADSFVTEKPWAAALCARLGLADRLVAPAGERRRTFVAARGRLAPLPDGFLLLAPARLGAFWCSPLVSWRGKLRAMMDLVLPPRRSERDESVAALVRRRLGAEVLERLVQPLLSAIYTVDPADVSARAAAPRFVEIERAHGSLIRGLRRGRAADRGRGADSGPRWSLFAAPAGGMADLVSALAQRLPASSVKLRRRATSLARSPGPRPWRVDLADGTALLADAVVLALPGPRAARLLAGVDASLAGALGAVPYHSSAVVTLAYARDAVRHPLDGLGFVVPQAERKAILACSFSSLKYPGRAPEGQVLFRVFVGGAHAAGALEREDGELAALVHAELAGWLGIGSAPGLTRVHRHASAMPQYRVGHADRVAAVRACAALHRGLELCGSAFDGLGIADCIHSGERAAEAALASAAAAGAGEAEAAPG
jgi:oxygen-dependent protoporphyrinogen oxidase